MSGTGLIMTEEDLEQSIRIDEAFPQASYGLPLSRVALAGDLDLAFLQRETLMPDAWQNSRNLPLVAVVIDTVGRSTGPATWRSAVSLAAWADLAVLHRSGAEKVHYRHAAELAKTYLRVLLVEAPAAVFEDWLELLQRRVELAVEVIR